MRAPICCILGHVDAGKTHLLDYLRHSHISKSEAGGITQQIGATCFSQEAIQQFTHWFKTPTNIPSLLLVDTPGHDCFSQMRQIGLKVSDLAVIVVDVFKGLEKQTRQCLELLQEKKIPYIIAINKIDRLYKWKRKSVEDEKTDFGTPLKVSLAQQSQDVMSLFRKSVVNIQKQLIQLGLDAQLYYENSTPDDTISMVPISAMTGEGLPDLIMLIAKITDRQFHKNKSDSDLVIGSIIDHKKDANLGLLYHTILISGRLKRMMPILIRSPDSHQITEMRIQDIYVPNDETELKHKNKYQSVDEVVGSKGIALKLTSDSEIEVNLELGSEFYLKNQTQPPTNEDDPSQKIDQTEPVYNMLGVTINLHAKSMVDALKKMLVIERFPVREIHVGEINKSLIIKTASANLASKGSFEWEYNYRSTVILNYNPNLLPDHKLEPTLLEFAKNNGVTIFSNAIIYRLIEQYQTYVAQLNQKLQAKHPYISSTLKMKILPEFIFKKRGQILFGVKVMQHQLEINQVIEANQNLNHITLGKVIGIQKASKNVTSAKTGDEVCIKIETIDPELEYGKQFDYKWELTNHLSAEDILLKKQYPDVFI